jgi:hypothetical protein
MGDFQIKKQAKSLCRMAGVVACSGESCKTLFTVNHKTKIPLF